MQTTRFSGAEWAEMLTPVTLIGVGGIGSWTALNLSRIGHELYIMDPDSVDQTNVTGGQMYRNQDIGKSKVGAVESICREFGCINEITTEVVRFKPGMGVTNIVICGLDNMEARKGAFEAWILLLNNLAAEFNNLSNCLFIDGRLTMEMYEVFTIYGNSVEQIKEYQEKHLFTDAEADELDCTTKQSTFAAMGISSIITGTLCNFLTNLKLGYSVREVPFYQRYHLPSFTLKKEQVCQELEKSFQTIGK